MEMTGMFNPFIGGESGSGGGSIPIGAMLVAESAGDSIIGDAQKEEV